MNDSEDSFRARFIRLMEENKQNTKKKLTTTEDEGNIPSSTEN